MTYIYNGELYCNDCAEKIKYNICKALAEGVDCACLLGIIDREGWEDLDDEERIDDCIDQLDEADRYTYDADEYPVYCAGTIESDSPDHCACGEDCVNGIELCDGRVIGELLSDDLTAYGIEYVKNVVSEGGPIAALWEDCFRWIDFDEIALIEGYDY